MKILLVNDYGVLAGGAERITVDLRDGMRRRGHEVRLLASTASPFPLPNEADDTCVGTNGPARRLLQVWNPWAVRTLSRVLREFQPDVVHVRMFLTQLSPAILPVLARVPALLHVGTLQPVCPLNTRVLPDGSSCDVSPGLSCYRQGCVPAIGAARAVVQLGAWRRHARVFRLIVANSAALAAMLRRDGVPVGLVVPNGTREVAARPPLVDPPTVAFAGRLVARKGAEDLVRAMVHVRQRVPEARLVIAGDGDARAGLERLVQDLGLAGVVALTGHVAHPALDRVLEPAWVQVVPSRSPDPGANVIPEAMMRGTAVVATRFDADPEGLREGVTGFLVPPFDQGALVDRLVALLGDRRRAEAMGAAGRAVAVTELTTARMLDRFEALYADVVRPQAAMG